MSPENGGLFIDKGSFPTNSGEEEILSLDLNPGDLLFMHPHLLHWSFENTSNKSRRTLLTGFCVHGANHRNYPGNCTNDVFHADGTITASEWKTLDDESF
jgi:ectoine hydroxylase-related dioxygenase (phytanoyl-CoA dioxygenase family)